MKTAEELLSIIIPDDDYWQDIFPKIIEAMKEYASQFREISEISDEEINNTAEKFSNERCNSRGYFDFIDGAKWYRDQLRKTKEI